MKETSRARGVRGRLSALLGMTLLGGSLLSGSSGAARALEWGSVHDPATCARPALWVVSDADTTIYLFGTIHAHDGRAHWFDHAVRVAFDASDELVLETVVPTVPVTLAAPDAGGLAAARSTIKTARALGMSVQLGADQVLHRAAKAGGKSVVGLEDFAAQIAMYQSLTPAKVDVPMPASPPDPAVAPFLRSMVDSWNRGDSRPIEAVVGAVQIQSPDSYRRLFSDRNTLWAKWIGTRLRQPGTVFVAVGTGHLVGRESVQARLALTGIRSARVN